MFVGAVADLALGMASAYRGNLHAKSGARVRLDEEELIPGRVWQEVLEEIVRNLKRATQNALELVQRVLPSLGRDPGASCACRSSLSMGIWSDRAQISAEARQRLAPLVGKYLDAN